MASGMDSASWDRRYEGSELVWSAKPNRFLVAEAETLAPGRAIDLACGEGRNAVWLAERGWQSVGVDFSEVGLQKARELANSRGVNVEWVVADLLGYRPDPHEFDLVLVFYLQLAAASGGRSFKRPPTPSYRAARSCSSRTTPATSSTDTAARRTPPGSTPRATSSPISKSAGCTSSGRVERPVQTPDGERLALDALVRACRLE